MKRILLPRISSLRRHLLTKRFKRGPEGLNPLERLALRVCNKALVWALPYPDRVLEGIVLIEDKAYLRYAPKRKKDRPL